MFVELARHIFMLQDPHQGRIPYCHCMYIDDDRQILMDSSCGPDLVQHVSERGIDILLSSHFHEDHILNHDAFPQAEIWAHYLDSPGIRSREGFKALYGFNVLGEEKLGERFVEGFGLKDYRVDAEFTDGQTFETGHTRVQIMHLPGHTAGHCGFYFPDEHILYSGDIDLSGFGPWYGNIVSDVDQFIASIQKIKEINPRMIISGHKGIVEDNLPLRLERYLRVIYQHEEDILLMLQRPCTIDELADQHLIYGKRHEPYAIYRFGEKMSLLVHLRRLQGIGAVGLEGGIYFRR